MAEKTSETIVDRHLHHVNVYDLDGKVHKKLLLPKIFRTEFRPELIKRAVIASQANRRQPYGTSPMAGLRHAVRWGGKGRGISRVPRLMLDRSTGAQAPCTVGGRAAHPPKAERVWNKKINLKEKHKARASALAAVKEKLLVTGRGHRFNPELTLPVIVVDEFEKIDKTRTMVTTLEALGLYEDVLKSKNSIHIRAGRGKMRNRKYRERVSLLAVVKDPTVVRRSLQNLPGVDVVHVNELNAELLAPGGQPGRLTLFTESAIEHIRKW